MPENEAVVETEPVEDAKPEAGEELGEKGVEALRKERDARKAAEKAMADLAKQVKDLQDRDKTEDQKRQEEHDRLQKELADITAEKVRAEVAADTSVPTALLRGPASGSAEDVQAFADELIAWRGEQAPTTQKQLLIPAEGRSPDQALNGDPLLESLKSKLGISS